MRYWWLWCREGDIICVTDKEDVVLVLIPFMQYYKGRHIKQLTDWMKEQGEFGYEELEPIY